jgi:hypothetical protein
LTEESGFPQKPAMSRIEEAIQKLEKVEDHNICSSWREQLQEITFLLKKKV